MSTITTEQAGELSREVAAGAGARRDERIKAFGRTVLWVLVSGACYYLATQLAWELCISHTKVSLLFPPHAVLVSVLLLVPTRHWWAFTLAAIGGHLLAAYQAHWPLSFALHSEAFDAVQNVSVAAGLRLFIKSPINALTLRDAIVFVLVAVVVVPFGTAFWGAALTLSYHFGTHYWVEWRKLGISNGVTATVLVPVILLGVHHLSARRFKATPAQLLEAGLLGVGILVVGTFVFVDLPIGPDTPPALLYAPIPFLIWAALRFGLGGASVAMLVITFQAIGGAMRGHGPFFEQTPAENAVALQTFLLATALPLLFLAVVTAEEKRSRASMHESEARFSNMANTAPVMIWMAGTDQRCIFFNQTWLDFTGRTLEQEIGFGWAEGVHPEDFDRCLAVYQGSFDARKSFEMEYRLRGHDGAYGWVFDRGAPWYATDGAFIGYIGSCIDITARKLAEEAAHDLSGRLIHAQEETHAQIARELHDDLSQGLALLAVELDMFGVGPPADQSKVAARMEEFSTQVKRLASGVHQLSHELHPVKLEQLGLVSALRGFCKEFARAHQMAIEFAERDVPRTVPDDTALCLYRIAQEALHNVVKHSGGTAAQVELACAAGQLRLVVSDDGSGFDPQSQRTVGSIGLVSMSERARFVGGRLTIDSRPGVGTRVEACVPVAGEEDPASPAVAEEASTPR
jgi:PAS domain S-box-containing protein